MQAIDTRSIVDYDTLNRLKKVYTYFCVEMTFIILLVFFEPTFRRIVEGGWQRGRFLYTWTLSLDVHAVVAFLFLFLFLAQLTFGYWQTKKPSFKRYHAQLGSVLFYGIIPLFLLIGGWVTIDRAFSIVPEQNVIFSKSPAVAVIGILGLLCFILWYVIRSAIAIKQGDILMHVDGIFGTFIIVGTFPFIRFLYALFWAVRGESPFSVIGMFFITIAIILGHLLLGYWLAGRLRPNLTPVLAMILATILLMILGAGHYTFMDVP